jgi:hypothetical protein
MHKFLIYLSICFCLKCFGLSFSPSSEAGVQFRQWFKSPRYVSAPGHWHDTQKSYSFIPKVHGPREVNGCTPQNNTCSVSFWNTEKKTVVNGKSTRKLPDTEKFNAGQLVPGTCVGANVSASYPVFMMFVIQRCKMSHCALSKWIYVSEGGRMQELRYHSSTEVCPT